MNVDAMSWLPCNHFGDAPDDGIMTKTKAFALLGPPEPAIAKVVLPVARVASRVIEKFLKQVAPAYPGGRH
jgi:hypothetical protein